MMLIKARALLKFSPQELWDILTGDFKLEFDDGFILDTNSKETVYSRYFWRFHLEYDNLPLLRKHHVQSVMKNRLLDKDTHNELLNVIFWDTHDNQVNKTNQLRDDLSRITCEVTNSLYNDTVCDKIKEYVGYIDIEDFQDIMDNPIINEIKAQQQNTKYGIGKTQAKIKEAISGDSLGYNPILLATKTSVVRMSQLLLMIGPRGYPTDMDSLIFRYPILTGYIDGFTKLYDVMTDSRGGAQALAFAQTSISTTEYMNRRFQIMGQQIQRVHFTDCGSKETLLWKVTKENLSNIIGKYYYDDFGELLRINKDSNDLIGSDIKLRVIYKCIHPDQNGFCSVCCGDLAYSYLEGTKPGYTANNVLGSAMTTSLLQTKHEIGSADVRHIILDSDSARVFSISQDGIGYLLNPRLKDKKSVYLVVSQKEASGLPDVDIAQDINDLGLTKTSRLTEVCIVLDDIEEIFVSVTFENRKAFFTKNFLRYVKQHGYKTTNRGYYCIALDKWNYEEKIMELPMKHYNMSDHAKLIADMIESRVSKLQQRSMKEAADGIMYDLYDVVNNKLNIHFSILDVVFWSTTIRSSGFETFRDYSLAKINGPYSVGVMRVTMGGRSLGPAMAFQDHHKTLTAPYSDLIRNRPDHPLDILLTPNQIAKERGWYV